MRQASLAGSRLNHLVINREYWSLMLLPFSRIYDRFQRTNYALLLRRYANKYEPQGNVRLQALDFHNFWPSFAWLFPFIGLAFFRLTLTLPQAFCTDIVTGLMDFLIAPPGGTICHQLLCWAYERYCQIRLYWIRFWSCRAMERLPADGYPRVAYKPTGFNKIWILWIQITQSKPASGTNLSLNGYFYPQNAPFRL